MIDCGRVVNALTCQNKCYELSRLDSVTKSIALLSLRTLSPVESVRGINITDTAEDTLHVLQKGSARFYLHQYAHASLSQRYHHITYESAACA